MSGNDSHIFLPVFQLMKEHENTWRNYPESDWLIGLKEEVEELTQSLAGKHEHTPEIELRQIASICLNWLDMRFHRSLELE